MPRVYDSASISSIPRATGDEFSDCLAGLKLREAGSFGNRPKECGVVARGYKDGYGTVSRNHGAGIDTAKPC